MNWFMRIVIFVPAVFCIMVVYSAPHAVDAAGVTRIAVRKTGKVIVWTVVLIVAMHLIEFLFLP